MDAIRSTAAQPEKIVLAVDAGGTKTNLGLFRWEGDRPVPVARESLASRSAGSIEELIAGFLGRHEASVSTVCIGIAGPVRGGVCKATNLPWLVSGEELAKRFGWRRVDLINDLTATAYSVPVLSREELSAVNEGQVDRDGTIGILAPGTGLGMSLVVVNGGKLIPLSSEGGHVEFAPKNQQEARLLLALLKRTDHVSLERLVSGPGLLTIHSWLRERAGGGAPPWLVERMERDDPSHVISTAALAGEDPICEAALDMFVSILGSAAGNLALTGLTTGGLYLGGGICPKILPKLSDGTFMEAFAAKGRFRELLEQIPVKVILEPDAALVGAAVHAFAV